MKFFRKPKADILEDAINAEKQKLEQKKALFEQKRDEFHKVKPIAGDILGGYVEIILKQRGKTL